MLKDSETKWNLFLSGDNEAYASLYNVYLQILYRYGLQFTPDSEIVKDCIQEIFTNLYKNRAHLPAPDNVKAYLLVALKNSLIKALNKESFYHRRDVADESLHFAHDSGVEEQFIAHEDYVNQQEKIKRILAALSPRQREIIRFRYIQELGFEEIGSRMNLNYQSCQNLIQRALKKIREEFHDERKQS
jgi:RNA polymerase sigma factor (sigma-70 family)